MPYGFMRRTGVGVRGMRMGGAHDHESSVGGSELGGMEIV